MSHFYGILQGSRGGVTRCGTQGSGVETHAAGWGGAIRVKVWAQDGVDHFTVLMVPWSGMGAYRLLASGILGETDATVYPIT